MDRSKILVLILLLECCVNSRAEECESVDDKLLRMLENLERRQDQILLRLGMAKSRGGVLNSCSDAPESGIYRVWIGRKAVRVYCKMVDYQMWMVIHRRFNGSLNFTRSWMQYQKGFGRPDSEFYLGNEYLYQLTTKSAMKLRIELTTNTEERSFSEYSNFWLKGRNEHYALHVSGHSGPAGNAMRSNDKKAFSAYDQLHDGSGSSFWCDKENARDNGAWWDNHCTKSNLNGQYGSRTHHGMFWEPFVDIQYHDRPSHRYIVTSEMMVKHA